MRKFFLLVLFSVLIISCSKEVKINGVVKGGSPLERIEFIDASGVATLPLTNIGLDEKGNFKGSFDAPRNGMYAMTYAGQIAFVYLKKGQEFNISGEAGMFPNLFNITGAAKANNDYYKKVQNSMDGYMSKLNMSMIAKDEKSFLAEMKKVEADLNKVIEDEAKTLKPDSEVVQLKKDELITSILTFMGQYEENHGEATGKENFKVSAAFKEYMKSLEKDNDRFVKTLPTYRNYLLGKLSMDFQNYAMAQNDKSTATMSQIFARYIKDQKDMSQTTKDYLLAFVIAKFDLNPFSENVDKLKKLVDDNIKDSVIKKDMHLAIDAVFGMKKGVDAPGTALVTLDGKSAKLTDSKDKPTLVMTYASWNPYIAESIIPVLKEVNNFYKSKVNFAFVNLDDTKEQFTKTSNAMLKGISGTNYYAEGGLNSQFAKDYFIYGFKIPGFFIIDKNGKIASETFYNLGEPKFVEAMNKVSGLKAPTEAPNVQLTPDMMQMQSGAEAAASK